MQTTNKLLTAFSVCLWAMLPDNLWGQMPSAQPVAVDIYRLERQDSCMVLDMSVNLSRVRIIPDCTVFLVPVLRSGSDSLELASLMLNGPQSDRMYRRKRALGYQLERLSEKPYLVLREGEHPLPAVSYRARVPYTDWMAKAELLLRDVPCDCDARLQPVRVEISRIPPVQVVLKDTVLVHDTIYMSAKKTPVWKETTEYKGYRADIYFPGGSFEIIPEHTLNREAWWKFNQEVNSLQARKGNTLLGITVTGYASPEGSYEMNENLAHRRARILKTYLEQHSPDMYIEIRTAWVAENWDELEEMVAASQLPEREEILEIIRNTAAPEARKAKLKILAGGRVWAILLKEYFPKLRRVSCRIDYLKTE